MTLYEFNKLSMDDKYDFALDNCVFLVGYAEDTTHSASLYYCSAKRYYEEFFIEVWYNAGNKQVDSIRSFRTNRLLEPYLEGVDLSWLRS